MFARLTTAQIKMKRIDEFIKLYEESVVPAAKTQKGYCGSYLFVDRETGNGVAISLWDKEEDALANEQNLYYQEQVAKFITFYKKNPIREGYEVCVKA
ncbi:MAG: hypothetical protein GQ536_01765 [Candidatus Aminicenantes bacterium]|nr:hypothetical protein [Candidatus Aminicenantes bacterium]